MNSLISQFGRDNIIIPYFNVAYWRVRRSGLRCSNPQKATRLEV